MQLTVLTSFIKPLLDNASSLHALLGIYRYSSVHCVYSNRGVNIVVTIEIQSGLPTQEIMLFWL